MIFLTGSTGFLGQELLGRLLLAYPDQEFGLLVRSKASTSANDRVRSVLLRMFHQEEVDHLLQRITIFDGDVSHLHFGLDQSFYSRLVSEVSAIFHCAALISFGLPIEEARRVNVGGVRNIIELTKRTNCGSKTAHLHHVSTAYAAGDVVGTICADYLDLTGNFRNTYEQSKAEAEALIRSAAGYFPFTIYRPSMIVGDSITGQTSSFNAVYGICRYIAKGLIDAVLGTPDAPCDVVPVDYVSDSIAQLSKAPMSASAAYHLCAGSGRESNPREIFDAVVSLFNKYQKEGLRLLRETTFISPEVFALAHHGLAVSRQIAIQGVKSLEKILHRRPELFHQAATFASYMTRNPRFDTSHTELALLGHVPPPPLFSSYCENLFGYCFETDWGKIPWTNPRNLATWVERRGIYVGT